MISSTRLRNSGRKCARTVPITCSRTAEVSSPSGWLTRNSRTEIRGHDDQRVAEVDRAALTVGQAAVVEHLQQHVEDIGMRLFDFVEQHDLIRPPPHRFGERAALVIADIARRRADQTRHRMLLHVFGHVDANHRGLVVEQIFGQRLGQFGLADAGGAQEHERAHRAVRILQPGAGTAHRGRHRVHRFGLADHALAEAALPSSAACPFRPPASCRPARRSSATPPARCGWR